MANTMGNMTGAAKEMKDDLKEETKPEIETLKEDLAKLRHDMADLIGTVKEFGKHRAHDVKDKAQAEVEHRLHQLSEAYDAVRREGHKAADNVIHTVEDRPLASVAIAFAAGLLLGKVIHLPGNNR